MRSGKKSLNGKPLTKKRPEEILSRKNPLQDIMDQSRFMEDAQTLPNEDQDSPTPGFTFGMRMGCVREDVELSMNKMAKSLGIAPSTWKNYEEDVTFPSTELIMKFCELYNVNQHWLMTNYGNMYKESE